jgi:hypothetical protein
MSKVVLVRSYLTLYACLLTKTCLCPIFRPVSPPIFPAATRTPHMPLPQVTNVD